MDRDEENSDWAMALQKALCWVWRGRWMTARLSIGTLAMLVTHVAGCRRPSAVIRNAARRSATKIAIAHLQTADTPGNKKEKTGAGK